LDSGRRWGEPVGAWLALAACVITIVLTAGTRASFAAFLKPIEQDLGLDRLTLSTAGALTALGYGLILPLAGRLANRYGARPVMMASVALMALGGIGAASASQAWQLLLFAGLLPGLGFGGASQVPGGVLLARWFGARLGLAFGVMSSAIPAGMSLFVPLVAALIPLLGWRATYLLLGLLLAAGALPALWALAREPAAASGGPAPTGARPRAGLDVWLLGLGYFGCGFTDQFVALHLVALAVEQGVEPLPAAGFLSGLLVFGVLGSVLSGPLADRRNPRDILSGLYLGRAAVLPLLLLIGPGAGLGALAIFALLFGLTFIANQAPGARYVRDHYGVEAVGPLMGAVGLAHQIGGAAGIGLGGLSVAQSGGYGPAVLAAAVVALVAGLAQRLIRPSGTRGAPRPMGAPLQS
jgi:MFS family permease